jgi:hypothetical protein
MESSFTPSAMAAFSYRWNQGTENNESCLAKCYHALRAFASAVFGTYTVNRVSLDENYLNKYEDSIFCKEYRKMNDFRITHTAMTRYNMHMPSTNKRRNPPLETADSPYDMHSINKRRKNPREEAIIRKRNEIENKRIGIECAKELKKKKVLQIKAKDFKALMLQGKFEDDIHYIVDGSIDFSNYPHKKTPPLPNITMPKYVTVTGSFLMDYQSNFTKFPKIFIVQGNLSLTHCNGLENLFDSKLQVYGELDFSHCINMIYAPNAILGQFNISFDYCQSLEEPPEQIDIGGAVPPSTVGCSTRIIEAFEQKMFIYSKLIQWLEPIGTIKHRCIK